jgi:hypothetical protein
MAHIDAVQKSSSGESVTADCERLAEDRDRMTQSGELWVPKFGECL